MGALFFRKLLAVIGLVILLSACSERGAILIDPPAAEVGAAQEILVATTRGSDPGPAVLSGRRSAKLRFFDFTVSVPPDRVPGSVTFPERNPPDPNTDFLTVSADQLADKSAFETTLNNRLASLPVGEREVTVFVHGFNTTFAEGLYRQAQMSRDFETRGVSVNYAWPSAGDFRGYAHDRESVLFARDGLETTLATLARSKATRIVVAGHSMGAQLLMESLRQMAIRGSPLFFDKLAAVALFAPDIDVDVFRAQASFLRVEDIQVFVFVSNRDRALRFSSMIRGGSERLGSVSDVSRLGDLPVTVIDISRVSASEDPLQHSKAATSPTMIALMDGMGTAGLEMFRQEARRPTLLESGILTARGVADAVTSPDGR